MTRLMKRSHGWLAFALAGGFLALPGLAAAGQTPAGETEIRAELQAEAPAAERFAQNYQRWNDDDDDGRRRAAPRSNARHDDDDDRGRRYNNRGRGDGGGRSRNDDDD